MLYSSEEVHEWPLPPSGPASSPQTVMDQDPQRSLAEMWNGFCLKAADYPLASLNFPTTVSIYVPKGSEDEIIRSRRTFFSFSLISTMFSPNDSLLPPLPALMTNGSSCLFCVAQLSDRFKRQSLPLVQISCLQHGHHMEGTIGLSRCYICPAIQQI